MTELDQLSDLIAVLRGQSLAIGVDDVPRIATVLHHTRAWPRERRVRALKTLLARSPAERERFDHIAPLLLVPRSQAGRVQEPQPGAHREPERAETRETPGPPGPHDVSVDPKPRWPLVAGGVIFAAAIALALHAAWPPREPDALIDAGGGSVQVLQDAGPGSQVVPLPAGETRQVMVSEPSSLPGTFRGIAEASGVASLMLIGWSLLALRPRQRRAAAIERLARSPGRRTVRLTVDPSAIHPIDRGTIATLAHMLAVPETIDRDTTLDPGETIEQTARNAGRLTLCFAREREQPRLILLEDVSRSMERWPAHATQLARALEAQGQPVERRFIAGDPLQISERRSVDGRAARFEEATAGARVVVVSDGAHFDPEAERTARHARALDGAIWLQPRPEELWRAGARWLSTCAFTRTLGAVPNSLALPATVPAEWRPPRPRVDVDETADAWRSVLGDDAYLAFAATALLDLAIGWSATLVWALISDGVIAPPWRQFERIWDLPELAVLPGGGIRLAAELRDRLLADVRGERPELVQRVAAWIDTRLAAAIEAAGEGSLGAAVGAVYRDRVERAAGRDSSGPRVRQLAQRGLSSVIVAQVSGDEREAWRVRDPQAAWPARLRGPLLGLALLGTAGFGIAGAVAPAQRDGWQTVAIDAGVIDAPVDAYHADPQRGAQVAQRAGCSACHDSRTGARKGAGPSFIGMWGSKIPLDVAGENKGTARAYATVDDAYVWEKLSYPQAKVHAGYQVIHLAYRGWLSDSDILDLIAYLRSLANQPPAPDDAGVVDAEPAPSDGDAGDEAQDLVIAGTRTIDRDTVIRGKHVTIADGARLRVRHGATLRIEADDITVQGAAEIDGTGDRGAPGRDGIAEPDETVSDRNRFEQARGLCQKKRPDGRAGGNGGPGATIILQARRIEDRGLTVRVDGGAGGPGGRGAPGHRIEWNEKSAKSQFNPPSADDSDFTTGGDRPPAQDGKGDAKQDAKDPPKKRSSPAPMRQKPPSAGRASRRDVGSKAPSRDRPPVLQPQPRRRDTFKCPDGANGPPGEAGPRGSFSKSSPDDTGAAH